MNTSPSRTSPIGGRRRTLAPRSTLRTPAHGDAPTYKTTLHHQVLQCCFGGVQGADGCGRVRARAPAFLTLNPKLKSCWALLRHGEARIRVATKLPIHKIEGKVCVHARFYGSDIPGSSHTVHVDCCIFRWALLHRSEKKKDRCDLPWYKGMARRLAPSGVLINAVHPGAVLGTRLAENLCLKRGTHTAEVPSGSGGCGLVMLINHLVQSLSSDGLIS